MKKLNARGLLAALTETYPETVDVRSGGLDCFGLFRESYVCFGVQHNKYKPDEGLDICVNWGVVPEKLFLANPDGIPLKNPSFLHGILGVTRGRVTKIPGTDDDLWFRPKTPDDLLQCAEKIAQYARSLWAELLNDMSGLDWHIDYHSRSEATASMDVLKILTEA